MTAPGNRQPFTTRSVEVVHDWTYSKLVTREVASPDGEVFRRTYVDSPGAVAVVALTDEDEVVLVDQYRATIDDYLVEIPAGMRDKSGEEDLATAKRELEEETGFRAREWRSLGRMLSTPGVSSGWVELYLATGLESVGATPEGPEELAMTVLRVKFDEAVRMCMKSEITDSKSVIAILRAARLLGR